MEVEPTSTGFVHARETVPFVDVLVSTVTAAGAVKVPGTETISSALHISDPMLCEARVTGTDCPVMPSFTVTILVRLDGFHMNTTMEPSGFSNATFITSDVATGVPPRTSDEDVISKVFVSMRRAPGFTYRPT
ncbi:hypothetical protein AA21952_2665 [Acetobacter oeni LMG 21952]|nr:hypothetical protein AA21952_2665 [Acetobacter oeni LMG 21952]